MSIVHIFKIAVLLAFVQLVAAAVTALPPLQLDKEEPISFPSDSGVINVTQPPYNIKGDGLTDCTDVLQRAIDDNYGQNHIFYLPNGTYLVSRQIEWGPSRREYPGKPKALPRGGHMLTILQGESRDRTIIKLKDNSPDFQEVGIEEKLKDINRPKVHAVLWTGADVAQRFRNAIRNLTVNTGKGNPGAAGVQFNASNQGCMHAVKIVSGDNQGQIGLDLGFTGDAGPAAVRHIEIIGFDYGIWAASMNSFLAWDITLSGQHKVGIRCPTDVTMLYRIRSNNKVPALSIGNRWSTFVTLIDGEFIGGSADQSAIVIDGKPNEKHLFARNVAIKGYRLAVQSLADESRNLIGDIDEYSFAPMTKAFPDCSERTLNLPVKEAPAIPWGDTKKDWANVVAFGAIGDGKTDDSAAVQKAVDSGAKTIYFPTDKPFRMKEVILRANVQRVIACEGIMDGNFYLRDGTAKAVVVERFSPTLNGGFVSIHQQSDTRSLIVRDVIGSIHQEAKGDVFIDDVCGDLFMRKPGASVWCWYLNYEPDRTIGLINDGGNLWVMGSKVEHPGPKAQLINGSKTELLGGFWYASYNDVVEGPGIHVIDSALSIVGHRQHSFGKVFWGNWLQVDRKGETKHFSNWALDFVSAATPAEVNLPRGAMAK